MAHMREAKILCTIYLKMEDGMTEEEAVERVLMMIDPDLPVNIHKVDVEETD